MDGPRGKLLPFYLVVDVSASMMGEKIAHANRIVPEVADTIAKNPIIADKIRFGVIDFSDDAKVVLPLCDLLQLNHIPALNIRGGTSFVAAFNLLRRTIEADVNQLKADGYDVHRPAVFFVSDGEPTDREHEWKQAFGELTDFDKASKQGFSMYPNMIPFGVDQADKKTMGQLVHPKGRMKLYMADQESAGEAISRCAEVLISTVLQSGQSFATAGPVGLVLPDDDDLPAGITAYNDDDWL